MSNSITLTTTVTEMDGGDGKPDFGVSVKSDLEGNYVGSIADTLARILFAFSKQAAEVVPGSEVRDAWEVLSKAVNETVENEISRAEEARLASKGTLYNDLLHFLLDTVENSEEKIPEIGETVEKLTAELISALPLGARFIDRDQDIWIRVEEGMRMENESKLWIYIRFYGPYTRIGDLQEG